MEYHWQDVRDDAIEFFRETPGAELEGEILDQFQERPKTVITMISKIKSDIEKGKPIRSGWAVLRAALRQNSVSDVIVNDGSERERALKAAYAWLSNAGLYVEDEDSVVDELFTHGLLYAWRGDTSLQTQVIERWQELRPIGARAEEEAFVYQTRVCTQHGVRSRPGGRPAATEDPDPAAIADRDRS